MLVRSTLVAAVVGVTVLVSSVSSASGQTNSQRDAVIGGVAGAIIGGIAGKQNDETPEGIAIGGIAGAIAGHVLGKAKDRGIQDQYYYRQQAVVAAQRRRQQQAVELQKSVSVDDAISLSNTGVSAQLIINQIQSNGVQQEIGVSEIITLHQNGVNEAVINAMQRASVGGPAVTVEPVPAIVTRARPAIVVQRNDDLDVYRSHRGYYPYHGQQRSACGKDVYGRRY